MSVVRAWAMSLGLSLLLPAVSRGGEGFPSGTKEPSGIAFDAARRRLFVVGDEGTLAALDLEGRRLESWSVGGNLEDLAVHTPSGRLVLLGEKRSMLVVYDPDAGKVTGRFALDRDALLGAKATKGEADGKGNTGFEGIAFRPDKGQPGGGVFYLVHQKAPVVLVTVAFDPTAADGTIGAARVIARRALDELPDATAVTYVPSIDRLLVLSQDADRVAVLHRDGRREGFLPLGGKQQEGLAVDDAGRVWVADDRAGVVRRIDGGLAALRSGRGGDGSDDEAADKDGDAEGARKKKKASDGPGETGK
jgi:uncharacterized protein YjiK